MQDILNMAAQLHALKEHKKDIEDKLDGVKAEITEVEDKLVAAMIGAEIQNFNLAGSTFYLNSSIKAQVKAENMDSFIRRLRSRKLGGIVKTSIPAQTLAAFAKEQMADNNDELPKWMQPFVSTFVKHSIGVRKQK